MDKKIYTIYPKKALNRDLHNFLSRGNGTCHTQCVLITYESSEHSVKTAQMYRLASAFNARTHSQSKAEGPVKQNFLEYNYFFLIYHFNMCFGCSKDGSFEYPQHMFRLRNKKINFQVCILI